MIDNNLPYLNALPLVQAVMKGLGRSLSQIMSYESDPALGNGGLGRLASCFLDSFATTDLPGMGYGLRYQYGIFEQEIWNGVQVEKPDCWLLYENPWEFRRDTAATHIHFGGRPSEDHMHIYDNEEVRALPYDLPIIGFGNGNPFSVVTLRLWSTKESPRNFQLQRYNSGQLDQAVENTLLTDVLYPNDNHEVGKRIRLKQEYLLASASCQDILRSFREFHPDLSLFGDKVRIQVNDTHPALIVTELMWRLMKEGSFTFDDAWGTVNKIVSYTNHTVMKEALEEWNESRLKSLLPCHHALLEKINDRFCSSIRIQYPGDEEKVRRLSILEGGQVRMANLLIATSHHINGVAKLHTEILKKHLFRDFYELFPERFINITNGVTQRRWLLNCNPLLAEFISKRIGREWIIHFEKIEQMHSFADDPDSIREFLAIKKANKEALIALIKTQSPLLDSSWLIDVQIKRFHEYKRQLMNILHVIILYLELKENPTSHPIKRAVLFAGKAAPGYVMAKHILRLICAVARKINKDPLTEGKLQVLFVENYNVSKAELIIPAADLSQQISTSGTEASGTGNMKLAMNGALTIGTPDGANIEMEEAITAEFWPFGFGATSEELNHMEYSPWKILEEHPLIHSALQLLTNRTFAENTEEHEAFLAIYHSLIEGDNPDHYFVLYDLPAYLSTQKKVEELYIQPEKWASTALHNLASMGPFSIDIAVRKYAKEIWGVEPCPPSELLLNKVREEYSEHDKCRIL
ncbi:MAG: glycogen/starch/alpha-glucan phosphorylase [Chlamydiota bacterium]